LKCDNVIGPALVTSDDGCRAVLEVATDCGIRILSPGGAVLRWDGGARARTRPAAGVMQLGEHFSTFYSADDKSRGKPDRDLALARAHGRFAEEGWRADRDGTAFWARVVITAMKDAEGRLIGFSEVSLDLSESRRMHDTLARAQGELEHREKDRSVAAQFRGLLEATPDAIAIVTHEGSIVLVNTPTERMFGYDGAELVGRSIEDLVPLRLKAEHSTAKRGDFPALVAYAAPLTSAVNGVRNNGSVFPVEISLSPLDTEEGVFVSVAIRDITDRKRTEALINKSLREKELLLKEVHHRVKNNLQVISSLLKLQAQQVQDNATKLLFNDSQARVRSIALLHEKLYQSSDIAGIDMDEYVRDLTSHLAQSYGTAASPIEIVTDARGVFLGVDLAMPCGLIINELVTNSFKHAFTNRPRGLVSIRMTQADGQIELTVTDDGRGLPVELDVTSTTTVGLHLVRTLSEQLEATRLEYHGGSGGTTCSLAFPATADGGR
jgi:PAS domain S-box-containing protein